jgi:hypothetical protein
LGSLITNLNSNISANGNGNSAFKRNFNQNFPKSSSKDSLCLTEHKIPPIPEDKYANPFNNLQKSNNRNNINIGTSSKILNFPTNLFKENSYLKLLIIAAESIMEKGLHLLQEMQIEEKELSSSGLDFNANNNKHDQYHSIQKSDSSENYDQHSSKSVLTFSNIYSQNKLNLETGNTDLISKCDNKVCGVVASKKVGWCKIKINKSKICWLCRACYKAWKKNQFCYYCNVIYRDNTNASNYNDIKSWVQCDYCEMWQHIQCEEGKGFYSDL